ncbi:hypothetical protein SAMN05421771_3097 [Granulicella pectinivorans]|uniref:DinB superfamily protein n=1 Tax=Granulicella pectinivorans TaxID=474950 RepID=A0A1I6MNI9_9BACT|nr:hypothetical protein [Granulicella pectinivorans]SFS17262.1 hypothetical protein SAMN05421771_3097 [Granulicella pectinivorans]
MSLTTLLLPELRNELKATRTVLERLPARPEYTCHEKSMPLGKLAAHVAQLPSFGSNILTTPNYDFGVAKPERLVFESPEQVVAAFDKLAAKIESDLASTTDAALEETWALTLTATPSSPEPASPPTAPCFSTISSTTAPSSASTSACSTSRSPPPTVPPPTIAWASSLSFQASHNSPFGAIVPRPPKGESACAARSPSLS